MSRATARTGPAPSTSSTSTCGLRFEPARRYLSGEATLRLRLLVPATTLRLRLDDGFQVESVTSAEGGRHLFFRVRGQNSLMIPLGPLTGEKAEIAVTVRYSGVHEPAPVDQEVLQSGRPTEPGRLEDGVLIEGVLVYTNRTAWYPRPALDDHATALLRFDLPMGLSAVTGGERVSARVQGGRTLVEYRQARPAKYVTAAVGRFLEAGSETRGHSGCAHSAWRGHRRTRRPCSRAVPDPPLLCGAVRSLPVSRPEPGRSSRAPPRRTCAPGHGPAPAPAAAAATASARRSRELPRRARFFLAHELAHQWFGQAVSGANYRERWLSEGFAQYAAALWTRQSRGEGAFRDVLSRLARWAIRHDAEGPIHLGYRVGHLRGDAQAYRAVVYDKAAYVLHMLRAVVGDRAFFQGLKAYQEAHRYAKAGTDDLREALEAAAGVDLEAYFQAWVLGNGVARLSYRAQVVGEAPGRLVILEVEAQGLPGPFPVELRLVHEGGEETRALRLSPGTNELRIEAARRPRRIELNADRGLLARVDGG